MFPPEALFIWRIDDLKAILANPTTGNLLASSAILRALLLDEQPLVHQANRNLRFKISFTVCEFLELPDEFRDGLVHHQTGDGISPNLGPPYAPRKTLNLDGLLKEKVLEHHGQTTTVRDVIKYCANYAGGVHKDTPDTPQTIALEQAAALYTLEVPSVLFALRGIIDVVVTACDPLYQTLKG